MEDLEMTGQYDVIAVGSRDDASPSEWEAARPLIKSLYVDEDMTLKETMAVMAREWSHYGTVKQYKGRIKKWHFDKNTKEAEARALLRMKVRRDAVGKDSAFRVRGRNVTMEDVLRYFYRKGILNPEEEDPNSRAATPPGIQCWTPVSSPPPRFETNQTPNSKDVRMDEEWAAPEEAITSVGHRRNDEVQKCLRSIQIRRILFSSPGIGSYEIPKAPLPPQSLLVPEKLFASIKAYFTGAFESGMFITDENGYLSNTNFKAASVTPVNFADMCNVGVVFMKSKAFVKARRCFSKAFDLVKRLLQEQHPYTFDLILNIMCELRNAGFHEIATSLKRLIRGLVSMIFDEEYPWRQILSLVGAIDDAEAGFAIIEASRCMSDVYVSFVGRFHRSAIALNGSTAVIQGIEAAERTAYIQSLLKQCQQEYGKKDLHVNHLMFVYAKGLCNQDRETEAVTILDELLVRCQGNESHRALELRALCLMSYCHYFTDDQEEAELGLREAIEIAEQLYSKSGSSVLEVKVHLESWLRDWGRDSDADIMQAEIEELLGPDDTEELWAQFGQP